MIRKSMFCFLIALFTALSTGAGYSSPKPAAAALKGMVKVPAGTFTPFWDNQVGRRQQVKSFYLDARAVTNAEFLAFVQANPRWARSKVPALYADAGYLKHWAGDFHLGKNHPASPVTNVSWHAANAYAKWKGKRLPTTQEWEYAGQASLVNDPRPMEKIILEWYSKPAPKVLPAVGTTCKNAFRLYDMHGLVWEWVEDFNSILLEDDSRSNSTLNRSLFCASGSLGASDKEDYAAFMRFAFRGSLKASYTVSHLGFRCAKDLY